MEKGCEHCTPPGEEESCFPVYGLAPHIHVGSCQGNDLFGSTRFTGEHDPGCIENPEEPGMAWWFCTKCGAGKQYALDQIKGWEEYKKSKTRQD